MNRICDTPLATEAQLVRIDNDHIVLLRTKKIDVSHEQLFLFTFTDSSAA